MKVFVYLINSMHFSICCIFFLVKIGIDFLRQLGKSLMLFSFLSSGWCGSWCKEIVWVGTGRVAKWGKCSENWVQGDQVENKGRWAGFVLHLPERLYCCLEKPPEWGSCKTSRQCARLGLMVLSNMMWVSNLECNSLEINSGGFREKYPIFWLHNMDRW